MNKLREKCLSLASCLLLLAAYFVLSSCENKEKIRLEQYYIGGKLTYETNCANCHQKDGKGVGTLYPAIVGSDFLKNKEQVICLIRNGTTEEMRVNGKVFHQPMPPNKRLLDLDIAELTTYIYNEWYNEKVVTETDSVHKILARCPK